MNAFEFMTVSRSDLNMSFIRRLPGAIRAGSASDRFQLRLFTEPNLLLSGVQDRDSRPAGVPGTSSRRANWELDLKS